MDIALLGISCLLLVTFFQDLNHRRIHVVLPVGIFLCSCYATNLQAPLLISIVVRNGLFFLLTFFILIAYMTIKSKRFLNPFSHYFGLGDVLFYLSVTPLFLLYNYVVFFIGSMIFSIILQLVFKNRMKHDSVPLAGLSGIFLLFVLLADVFADFYKLTLIVR